MQLSLNTQRLCTKFNISQVEPNVKKNALYLSAGHKTLLLLPYEREKFFINYKDIKRLHTKNELNDEVRKVCTNKFQFQELNRKSKLLPQFFLPVVVSEHEKVLQILLFQIWKDPKSSPNVLE